MNCNCTSSFLENFSETGLVFCESYITVMVIIALTGASRGVNVVFLQMVIPDNVAIEQLPSAQGIYLLCNGFVFSTVGPLMSWMLGQAQSYSVIVIVLFAMNALTLIMWGSEYVFKLLRRREDGTFEKSIT